MPTLICDCNKTMPLQETILGEALGESLTRHSSLCRREAGAFQRAIQGSEEVVVACTQERRLFAEIGSNTAAAVAPVKFVNIRETGGWGRDAARAMPKLAALLAAAHLPDPDPVATVSYKSSGRLLIIGPYGSGRGGGGTGWRRPGRHLVRPGRRRFAGASVPGAGRHHRQPAGLARRLRIEVVGRQSDRPGPVHALQCLRRRLSGRCDRAGLPGRPGQMRVAPRLRQGLRRRRRDRLQPRQQGIERAVRPGAGPAPGAGIPPACPAAGLFPSAPSGDRIGPG